MELSGRIMKFEEPNKSENRRTYLKICQSIVTENGVLYIFYLINWVMRIFIAGSRSRSLQFAKLIAIFSFWQEKKMHFPLKMFVGHFGSDPIKISKTALLFSIISILDHFFSFE